MKLQLSTRTKNRAFTGWDLLICVVTVLLLAFFIVVPRATTCKAPATRINCVSNLKQIGLAFRMWANDHGEKFPMQWSVLSTNRGTMEFNLTGEVWRHFQIISNEINTPKVFFCREDKKRSRTDNWNLFTNNFHLSYFIGLDADETEPQTILSGDRNLTSTTVKPMKGVLNLAANDRVEWTKAMHNQAGNVALADGSASQATSMQLSKQFQAELNSTTQAVHRIALPE
jgi:hypothetical protein